MNNCAIQSGSTTWEEMRSSVTVSVCDKRDNLVCPKPRRLAFINTSFNEPISPMKWQMSNSHQSDFSDSKAGNELLDIILSRGGYTVEQTCTRTASPSPFFCGSPPSRVSNPLIQDARFGDEVTQISPWAIPIQAAIPVSPSSSARKGACGRANFCNKPVVRIEGGFDCLGDSRNCSIYTMA